jgi:2-polyprenyl-3-methyl-5-hydroxy-6-metoxy-1,4-benzoquinol methylase
MFSSLQWRARPPEAVGAYRTYQQITMPDGAVLSGSDRSYLHPLIFGEADDFMGKSLLDLGSYHGHFCIEALRRGAARAVGVEPYVENLVVAREIAESFSLEPEYIDADFEEWETDEKFDTVLCLNLLHHLYDPIHSLRKLVRLARERIVIEVAAPRFQDLRRGRISLSTILARAAPILALGRSNDSLAAADYTFIISPAAIKALFEQHYACFESVQITPSPFKERQIVVAQKRRVQNLTIVAGPTSSGKSTFIDRLVESPELRRLAHIPETIDVVTSASKLHDMPKGPLGHVIFHYVTLRPFDRSLRTYARDPAMSMVAASSNVTVLTLDPPREKLLEQIVTANPGASKRHMRLAQLYREPGFIERWHDLWLAHVAGIVGARHLLVDPSGNYGYRDVVTGA